ncbi:hypothetical protein LTR97_012083 [Elasticomyces elasticus]|uniref:Uncharacterized protein n=1 Tax=Elasticomyces elasticus TaxID=574655 RepID=A0AAN7ZKR0_9PEZI|nr:hypothetical protein LTR97_012083 [Elasticomyces elasticus]
MTLCLNENTDAAQGERAVRARRMPGTLLDLAGRITGLHSGLPQVLSGLDLMSTGDAVGCLVFFASAKCAAIIFRHRSPHIASRKCDKSPSRTKIDAGCNTLLCTFETSAGPDMGWSTAIHLDVSHPFEHGLGRKRHASSTDPRHPYRLPPHRTIGKPRTPGPASKKRKADDARYTEGEEATSNSQHRAWPSPAQRQAGGSRRPSSSQFLLVRVLSVILMTTKFHWAPQDRDQTLVCRTMQFSALKIKWSSSSSRHWNPSTSLRSSTYFDSKARLDRRPAIKQEADQETALEDIPPHSDDSGYGAPDSDAKVDVKSVSAAHATSADQLLPSTGSSSWHKGPVQADVKYETPAASATFPSLIFSAGSPPSGCLEVLQNLSTNNEFYAEAVDDVLKHAGDSPERISSVLAALHQCLPLERLGPIEQALLGNGLQFQAQALLANIDSPLTLRQVLLTIL